MNDPLPNDDAFVSSLRREDLLAPELWLGNGHPVSQRRNKPRESGARPHGLPGQPVRDRRPRVALERSALAFDTRYLPPVAARTRRFLRPTCDRRMGDCQVSRRVRSGPIIWAFGAFRLSPDEMLLTEDGVPVRLGSRAFALLVTLIERAGDVVSVEELLARAWPNIFVEEVTLRVHLHALKKVLGDGRGAARYIVNETGRGYRFVAPVVAVLEGGRERAQTMTTKLPARVTRMVGRSSAVDMLCDLLPGRRLLTLVGPGGVGKTTVAIAVAERLRSDYFDEAYFVDLTALNEPDLLPRRLPVPLDFRCLEQADWPPSSPIWRIGDCCLSSTIASTSSPLPRSLSRPSIKVRRRCTYCALVASPLGRRENGSTASTA